MACIFLTGAGAAPQADERSGPRERFVELDGEIQAIKEEILGINRDILLLEELSLYPHGQQLVVLVSISNNNPVLPDNISLQLDGKTVSRHTYTASEGTALQGGGVHRLYTGRLRDGEHKLEVSVTGKQARDRAFQQQRSVTITKGPGRKYLELHLGPGANTPEPGLTIREW
ncbi:MAG: hypothetical protein WBO06_05020 [Gammaproteobacteria bacterium]